MAGIPLDQLVAMREQQTAQHIYRLFDLGASLLIESLRSGVALTPQQAAEKALLYGECFQLNLKSRAEGRNNGSS